MSEQEKHLDVPAKSPQETQFRDDLREPTVGWGRCAITGEWGPTVALDLGDISVEAPLVDEGVEYDPNTKEVVFTRWRPVIFEQQLTVSRPGLEKLLSWLDDQAMPVPTLTPVLVYQWRVLYTDGSSLSQFECDSGSNDIRENRSDLIDFSRIQQASIVPREPGSDLAGYTYDWPSNVIYRNGLPIDVEYNGDRPEGASVFCRRKVTHTWGSVMGEGLSRELQNAHTTVLYLIGWHTYENGPCCIISVDERGNWRPWQYN